MIDLRCGDCLIKLKEIDDGSVDSIITDPPYGIKFMNKKWDVDCPSVEVWQECLRVLKPGGHLLSFSGTRMIDFIMGRIREAGFDVRDTITWLYGQGFPKNHNINKHLHKKGLICNCGGNDIPCSHEKPEHNMRSMQQADLPAAFNIEQEQGEVLQSGVSEQSPHKTMLREKSEEGIEGRKESSLEGRELYRAEEGLQDDKNAGSSQSPTERVCSGTHSNSRKDIGASCEKMRRDTPHKQGQAGQSPRESKDISEPQRALDGRPFSRCPECKKQILPEGLGTGLKPSVEMIVMARKPFKGSVTDNVLKHGTGGMNIDACRVEASKEDAKAQMRALSPNSTAMNGKGQAFSGNKFGDPSKNHVNTTFNPTQGRWPANLILDEDAGKMLDEQSGVLKTGGCPRKTKQSSKGIYGMGDNIPEGASFANSQGGASRFFYCAKSSRSERNRGLDKFYRFDIDTTCEENTEQVALLLKDILELIPYLSIASYGNNIMVTFQKECLSIIKTIIQKTTELKIWNLLMHSPTKESMKDVFLKMMAGISHADYVENSKELTTKIGILHDKVGLLTEDVKNATLKKLSNIKEPENLTNLHPTVKSLKLMEYLVKLVTPPGGMVLDPFMGSGSTGVAANKLNFSFMGIELSPEYFEIAQKRIHNNKPDNLEFSFE